MLQRTEIILGNSYQRKRMNRFESGWGIPDKATGADHRWCVPGPGSGYWYISIALFFFFFPGKAFLGPLLQLGTVRTINRFPCLLAPQGVGQACSLHELRVRVCPGLEVWLRCFAHLRWFWVQGACIVPCFCSRLLKSGSWIFGLFGSLSFKRKYLYYYKEIAMTHFIIVRAESKYFWGSHVSPTVSKGCPLGKEGGGRQGDYTPSLRSLTTSWTP